MKVRYLSDLHLEFIKPDKIENFIQQIPPGNDEVCILAGDIGNPYQTNYDIFMNFISQNFRKTFIISGNHEFYSRTKTVQETTEFMKEYFTKFKNITFLSNGYEVYDNHCFIGTTLWSKIVNPQYEISDVYEIPNFDYIEYNRLHMLSVAFLEDALQMNENCVVITHHLPSSSLNDAKYKTQQMLPYNQWFCCSMDECIERNKSKIKAWVYGHTHTPSSTVIHGVPFVCNPIGYPSENKNIHFTKTVTIND
jgi:predicted phosphodiesterase